MRRLFLSLTFVVSGFVAGMVLTGRMRTADESRAQTPAPPAADTRAVSAPVVGGLPDLSSVASRAIPSVMNISSLQVVRSRQFAADPLFQYFFGSQDDAYGARNRISQSLGSGVVISSDGYILTNNHV